MKLDNELTGCQKMTFKQAWPKLHFATATHRKVTSSKEINLIEYKHLQKNYSCN